MSFEPPLEKYSVKVREVAWGSGEKSLRIGGENTLPLHRFEGAIPNRPALALEITDIAPQNWPEELVAQFREVLSSPVEWAGKCARDYGADAVCLNLLSTDPLGADAPPGEAAATARMVADSIDVPLIVWGTGDEKKDAEVLPEVAKSCSGKNLLLGPVLKQNFAEIAGAAKEHGHGIVAQASMDANLTKELNIALCKFFPADKIVIDPTSSALGYGLEFTFSIIERIKQFGLADRDNMMLMPIMADVGAECWRAKEAKADREQGILWEAVTGLSFLLAGANILILRHPDSLRSLKEMINGSQRC